MPPTLTFLSWTREQLGGLATATVGGRARGQTDVTLSGTDAAGAPTTSETRTLAFLLAGPPDVVGLKPGAIAARYPQPGAIDAESDKCPHAELADPTLPWRYSPAPSPPAGTGALHPWLALVVGVEGDELTLAGEQVALSVAAQALHPIGGPAPFPWAHVQVDESGRRVGWIVAGRALAGGQDYLAVLVPTFAPSGAPAWTGGAAVTLPVYDHWRFRTATPPGSFRDLAGRLHPGEADPDTGRAPLDYPRVPAAGELEVRGALAPIGSTDALLPPAVADDLAGLASPATDPQGRPIVGLPVHGADWHPNPRTTAWGAGLNDDPRHRGVAGLGLELGIGLQEELVADAAAHAGALAVAAQRVRHLALGLRVSAALWERRLPADPLHRLWVLGPALARVASATGTVAELATADDRALPRGVFSSAARRVLRPGPARTAALRDGPPAPAALFDVLNRCPDPPPRSTDGVALPDDVEAQLDDRLRHIVDSGAIDVELLLQFVEGLSFDTLDEQLREIANRVRARLAAAAGQGAPAPWPIAVELLVRASGLRPDDARGAHDVRAALLDLLERWDQLAVPPDELVDLFAGLEEPPVAEPPCRPLDLVALADGVAAALDPTGKEAPALVRVLATIDGLDPAQPLAPPEVCVGLDRPAWRDVEGTFAEWLLPGVGLLPVDSVIALETNPVFTDALMTGYNGQLLAELRWRNHPVATGCTPLRVFWERADTGSGDRVDDIVGIDRWEAASDLGAPQHRPGGAAARDLVVVVRGQLFLRYPRTIVYLVSAAHGATVDFDQDPDVAAGHVLPTFQGRIGADVTFLGFQGFPASDVQTHWVVFEEPPAGYRFYNAAGATPPAGADGATFARVAFADPVRVLIRGDRLVPGGGP